MSSQTLEYGKTPDRTAYNLAWIGSGLSIGGAFIGMGAFVLGCAGVYSAFMLSYVVLALCGVGFILNTIGVVMKAKMENAHVVATFFISLMGLLGGMIELAILNGWTIFPHS